MSPPLDTAYLPFCKKDNTRHRGEWRHYASVQCAASDRAPRKGWLKEESLEQDTLQGFPPGLRAWRGGMERGAARREFV